MSKLSIIVPVYNTEKYLYKCLDSLVKQTLEDIEIIVVNDGSTDNSNQIINEFYNNYPNKIVILDKPNGGLSDARNYGINHAKGTYIGFVDSDDYVEPNMFEEMYLLAISQDLDLVECNFSWDYPTKTRKDIGINYKNTEDFFTSGRVMACNKIYKTSIIQNNNIKFPYGLLYEDIEFFYTFISYINKYKKIDKIFYHYVQRENSIINCNNEKVKDIFNILDNILNFYKSKNLYNQYEVYLEYLCVRLLLGSSFLRIVKISNKKTRNKLLLDTYLYLERAFPNWKGNKILNKNRNKKNLYYKSVNKFTYKFYSLIFRIF